MEVRAFITSSCIRCRLPRGQSCADNNPLPQSSFILMKRKRTLGIPLKRKQRLLVIHLELFFHSIVPHRTMSNYPVRRSGFIAILHQPSSAFRIPAVR